MKEHYAALSPVVSARGFSKSAEPVGSLCWQPVSVRTRKLDSMAPGFVGGVNQPGGHWLSGWPPFQPDAMSQLSICFLLLLMSGTEPRFEGPHMMAYACGPSLKGAPQFSINFLGRFKFPLFGHHFWWTRHSGLPVSTGLTRCQGPRSILCFSEYWDWFPRQVLNVIIVHLYIPSSEMLSTCKYVSRTFDQSV
jgi:hypothetical protein